MRDRIFSSFFGVFCLGFPSNFADFCRFWAIFVPILVVGDPIFDHFCACFGRGDPPPDPSGPPRKGGTPPRGGCPGGQGGHFWSFLCWFWSWDPPLDPPEGVPPRQGGPRGVFGRFCAGFGRGDPLRTPLGGGYPPSGGGTPPPGGVRGGHFVPVLVVGDPPWGPPLGPPSGGVFRPGGVILPSKRQNDHKSKNYLQRA